MNRYRYRYVKRANGIWIRLIASCYADCFLVFKFKKLSREINKTDKIGLMI